MTQQELVVAIADRTGLSREQVRKVLRATVAIIHEQVVAGESVRIAGLGAFSRSWRAGRQLRDITSQRKIFIDGRYLPRFQPAAPLRRALAGLTEQNWRDPAHQKARRLATTLVGDLLLYSQTRPESVEGLDDAALRALCGELYGELSLIHI